MTENEAIRVLKQTYDKTDSIYKSNELDDMFKLVIKALKEIQQYRAIGTVEEISKLIKFLSCDDDTSILEDLRMLIEYSAIGTIDEFKDLKEKSVAKKPIEKVLPYSEEYGFNSEWKCPTCGAYVGYFSEGMSEPEQMEYCNECGQHIAKDWAET